MNITEMKACHVAQVAQLEAICFSDPWSENSIASELNNALSYWLVAQEDGVVVGYIGSQTVFPESDVMNVAVHPDYRRKGIGAMLVEALITHLRNNRCESLTLEVRASNESAIALDEKLGLEQVGLRKNYYRNPKENALILRKVL
ncbi:MAG: ribosomal protein S18-alanine N-acetyltransferase [Oscillospiraceae bacterium]|nr:ribosomal protein S18-alanine N-acetyltransferase [Oscillospiraceae bacterium]